ncbi:hypothetical protein T484DRAFT_1957662 [Baffinella frigidus]|nr:hypothetical protein T484DRAFT_1957662 [Cryptophyta sp. CCMP2293]
MSSTSVVRFNLSGEIFEVKLANIQDRDESLLAKIADGHIQCGQDERGAYLVERNLQFLDFALDESWEDKEHLLAPGAVRQRVLEELEFYYLQLSPRSWAM